MFEKSFGTRYTYDCTIKNVPLDDIKRKAYYLRNNRNAIISYLRSSFIVSESPILYQNEYAPLIATICDGQVKSEAAWNFPEWLDKRVGGLTLENILNLGAKKLRELLEEYLRDVKGWPEEMSEKSKKEYLDNTSKYIIKSLQYLKERGVTPITIFENREYSATEVYFVLRRFAGIGPKKAAMIARDFIYASAGLIKRHPWFDQIKSRNPNFKVTHYIIPPIDVHVLRVFCRLFGSKGTINWEKVRRNPDLIRIIILIQDIIVFSIMVFPEQPSMLDEIFWNVGRKYCKPRNCLKCPLREICGYVQKSKKL